jgi:NitT/TauT family transport system permease protein
VKRLLIYSLSPLLAIGLWELASRAGWLDYRFFPPPSAVLHHLIFGIPRDELWTNIRASVQRVVVGYTLGSACGLALGLAMGLTRWLRSALYPLVAALYPIPKIAVLPLIMLVFGLGELSKIVVVAIGSFFLVLLNALRGVDDLDRIYYDLAKIYQVNVTRFIWQVVLPGALPAIFTGLRLAIGYSLVVVVAAEFSGANSGIGYMIWQAWETFSIKTMYAGIVLIALLGIGAAYLLDALERWLIPWRRRHAAIG